MAYQKIKGMMADGKTSRYVQVDDRGRLFFSSNSKIIRVTKPLGAASAYHATDVLSESTSVGKDWDFNFGFTGELVFATVVSVTTALTPRLVLHLYRFPPACQLNDHATATSPVAADLVNFICAIDFPSLTSIGTGMSYSVATPSTYGNIPILLDTPKIYGVLHTLTAFEPAVGGDMTIFLGAKW